MRKGKPCKKTVVVAVVGAVVGGGGGGGGGFNSLSFSQKPELLRGGIVVRQGADR